MASSTETQTYLQDMVGELKFEFSDVPDPVLRRNISHIAQELGEHGLFNIDIHFDTYDGVADYELMDHLPDGWCFLQRTSVVKFCGCCIEPVDKCDPCPYGYSLNESGQFTLYPTPCGDNPVDICMDIMPEMDNCDLPDAMFKGKSQMVLHGVRALLLRMNNKPWSDPRQATYHKRQFDAAIVDETTRMGLQGDTNPTWAPPRIL